MFAFILNTFLFFCGRPINNIMIHSMVLHYSGEWMGVGVGGATGRGATNWEVVGEGRWDPQDFPYDAVEGGAGEGGGR